MNELLRTKNSANKLIKQQIITTTTTTNMQGYRSYAMENHHSHHHEAQEQKPLVVDLMSGQYGKPQTPPPSPTGKFSLNRYSCSISFAKEILKKSTPSLLLRQNLANYL